MALNTKAKKIHKGSPHPPPPRPADAPLVSTKSVLDQVKVPIMKLRELGGGWACLRIPFPPPPLAPSAPRKTPPSISRPGLWGETPGLAALRLLVKSCMLRLQTPSCQVELHQASV